jgi:ribosome-associated toxin RatA of RatAB toxin-antitoxin module
MKIERSALVKHSAMDMYGLVADVLSYPQFLSWCADSQVHEQGPETQKASLTVVVAGIRQQFTTLNTLNDGKWVKLELMKGPFRSLQGEWSFAQLGEDGCRISLRLEFEMIVGPMSVLFGTGFGKIANQLLDDFCKRAEQVYAS